MQYRVSVKGRYQETFFFLLSSYFTQPSILISWRKQARGGQRYFFGGCAFARLLPLFFTSASASSLQFQICQCAKRYSAIAEASARRYPPPPPQRHRLLGWVALPPVIGSVSLASSKEVQGGEEVNPRSTYSFGHLTTIYYSWHIYPSPPPSPPFDPLCARAGGCTVASSNGTWLPKS
jgi:hypothetical protein